MDHSKDVSRVANFTCALKLASVMRRWHVVFDAEKGRMKSVM